MGAKHAELHAIKEGVTHRAPCHDCRRPQHAGSRGTRCRSPSPPNALTPVRPRDSARLSSLSCSTSSDVGSGSRVGSRPTLLSSLSRACLAESGQAVVGVEADLGLASGNGMVALVRRFAAKEMVQLGKDGSMRLLGTWLTFEWREFGIGGAQRRGESPAAGLLYSALALVGGRRRGAQGKRALGSLLGARRRIRPGFGVGEVGLWWDSGPGKRTSKVAAMDTADGSQHMA